MTCPIANCIRIDCGTHLLCRKHWRAVPLSLQWRVYRAYANLRQTRSAHRRRVALQKYEQAVTGAIAAVTT